ncbi:MAG: zinc-binding dehydrogenase [Actinobacteria bacterium]|nr:zinc-binding dehydrogenase [Actinomycetota bacterium]
MKTMLVQELGSLDALEVVEMESPALIDGHVRIDILACGLNYVDSLMIEGKYQIKPPVPYRPGSEVVGRVTEVAADVTNVAVGDRVFVPIGIGGFSDQAVVHASRTIKIPSALSDGQGATFMQSYLTAWFAFHKRATVREGATMLVLGAGGGVGLAAVDLGVAMGLRVIAAASSEEKRQLAIDRGAFAAVDVLTEDVKARTRELCGGGVDMVYDPVGGDLAEPCLRALAPFGQYMVVGFVGGIPRLPANHVLLTNRTIVGVDWGAWVGRNQIENAGMLMEVLSFIEQGKLHPVEPVTYPMSKAVQAMQDLQNRKIAGKVALTPQFD